MELIFHQWIVDHPDKAQSMGARGRQSVLIKYNWENEVKVLFKLYERISVGSKNGLKVRM